MDMRALLDRTHRSTRTRLLCISLLLLPISSARVAPAQIRDNGVGGIISRADEAAVVEVNRHDAHALAAHYWDDAIDISPAGIAHGRPEIERRFAELFKTVDPRDFTESFDQENFSDHQGWLVGHWSYTRLASDGSRHPARGYVAVVLEQRSGEWKVRLHVITLAP
jgi:ketosteroid isomerase-like protein